MLPSPSPTYKCFVSGSIVDWICVHQIRVLETQLPKYCVLKRIPTFWDPMIYSHQIPLSMGFLRQEYWSGLPFPSPGNLPDPGIEPKSLTLWADSLPSEPPVKPINVNWALKMKHSSNRFSVFMKRNTREFSLCFCVSVSFPLSLFPTPPHFVRTHGETSLGRKSSYQNLTLLAPWSGTSSPQNCEERNFCC